MYASIKELSFIQFSALIGPAALQKGPDNFGCSWYSSSDGKSAASLHIDANTSLWNYVTFTKARSGWSSVASIAFEHLADVESAIKQKLHSLARHGVTVEPKPMRLRFGRGAR